MGRFDSINDLLDNSRKDITDREIIEHVLGINSPVSSSEIPNSAFFCESVRVSTSTEPSVAYCFIIPPQKQFAISSYEARPLTSQAISATINLNVNNRTIDRMTCSGLGMETTRQFDGRMLVIAQSGDSIQIEIVPRNEITTELMIVIRGFLIDV